MFTNSYEVSGTISTKLSGTKTLTGRALQAGEFTFALQAEGATKPLYTVTNGSDGKFVFPELSFDAIGTYQYTIYEVAAAVWVSTMTRQFTT